MYVHRSTKVRKYESTFEGIYVYSCTRTSVLSRIKPQNYKCYSYVSIIVLYGSTKVRRYSINAVDTYGNRYKCTVQLYTYPFSYLRKYFRTFVRKYFRSCTFEGESTFVRNKVRKYFRKYSIFEDRLRVHIHV